MPSVRLAGLLAALTSWLSRVAGGIRVSRLLSRRWELEDAVLFIVVAGQVVPVLSIEFFPSTDGAAHLDGAGALVRILRDDGWLTRSYYEFNTLQPNWTSHILLAALQQVFSPQLAERIVVASYAVLVPVSCRYVLAGFDPKATWAAILVTPFVFNWLLAMGFYNFCLGVPLMFLLIGYWLRRGGSAGVAPVAAMGALSVVTFFTHPLPLAMAVAVIVCLLAGTPRVERQSRIDVTFAGLSPALVLLGYFLLTRGPSLGEPGNASALWAYMRKLTVLVSIDEAEAAPAAVTFWLLAGSLGVGLALKGYQRARSRWDLWLLPAAGTVSSYFLMPDSRFSGQFVTPRLLLLSFLFVAVWLGSSPFPLWLRRAIVLGTAAIAMWMSALRAVGYAWFAPLLTEYVSVADHLTPNSTLLTLSYRPAASGNDTYGKRIRPFVHAGGYLSGLAGVLNMTNYEGDFRYFPLRFRDDVNPYVHLGGGASLERIPPCVDVASFNARTRERVDYVMTWGLDRLRHRDACTTRLLQQLDTGYELIHVTRPTGWGAVYRRRGFRRDDGATGRTVP